VQSTNRRFRLGLFVLVTGALFVALLGFILQSSFSAVRADYYIVFHENVKGMVIGSRVNFQGVPIGVVSDMRFQKGNTLVTVRVDPTRADIQNITRARMDRLLVTGQVTVELEGYGPEGKSLAPESHIEPKEDPIHALTASLPDFVQQAGSLLVRVDATFQRLEQMLGDENQARVAAILASTERATRTLADGTVPEATSLMHEATAWATGMRRPALTALASLCTTLEEVRALARQLKLAPDSLLFGVRPMAAPGGGDR